MLNVFKLVFFYLFIVKGQRSNKGEKKEEEKSA